MSINEEIIETGRRRRRRHSALFKAEAVGACQQPGVSVAAVALARGLNANMLHNWVAKAERKNAPIAIRPTAATETLQGVERFMPVALPASAATGVIRIEVRRKSRRVSIE
jgi:transposase-like protein